MLKEVLKRYSQNINAIFLIFLGSLTWCVTMVKSGWFYADLGAKGPGLGFWGANGHDGIWHLALAEEISKGTFNNPVFARSTIKNYHLGFDIMLAAISKLTDIPIKNIYFQIIPVVFALGIGVLVFYFVYRYTKKYQSGIFALFFVYFGGSFGYLFSKGESAFWSQQAISTLINPPYAASLIIVLAGLILIRSRKWIFAAILFGLLIEIKIYAGILVLGALLLTSVYGVLIKKDYLFAKVFLVTLLISATLFISFKKGSQDLVEFVPFWYLETLMGLKDRFDWPRYYEAMLAYKSGRNYLKMIPAYLISFILFIVGNMGSRIIAFARKPRMDEFSIFMYSVIAGGIAIPMLFLQKGTPWNTIQFFYYSLFFSGILAGIGLSEFYTAKNNLISKKFRLGFVVLIVLLTLPTTFITLKEVYIPARPPAFVGAEELEALGFLKSLPAGVVLTEPFDAAKAKAAETDPPRPLYRYISSAYVSAFSSKVTFLEDEVNLDITGYDWKQRRKITEEWYKESDFARKSDFLRENNISYIYWIKEGQSPPDIQKLNITNMFENDLVTVYKVN